MQFTSLLANRTPIWYVNNLEFDPMQFSAD